MNRSFAEKILATVFVLALFGGVYFLIQTFTAETVQKTNRSPVTKITASQEKITHYRNKISNNHIQTTKNNSSNTLYYYLEDFYVETSNGLILKTHSDKNFSQILSTNTTKKPIIAGPMLEFTEIKNGKSQQQYFNLEALVNQLNN